MAVMDIIADDLLVFGSTEQEHDKIFLFFLDMCSKVSATLKPNTLKLKCKQILFFTNLVSDLNL